MLYSVQCTLGWTDFEGKKLNFLHVVPNCYRTPIPKFQVLKCPFSLVAKNVPIKKKVFNSPVTGGNTYLDFLEGKMKRNS